MNNIDQNKNSVLPDEFVALVKDALPVQAEKLLTPFKMIRLLLVSD